MTTPNRTALSTSKPSPYPDPNGPDERLSSDTLNRLLCGKLTEDDVWNGFMQEDDVWDFKQEPVIISLLKSTKKQAMEARNVILTLREQFKPDENETDKKVIAVYDILVADFLEGERRVKKFLVAMSIRYKEPSGEINLFSAILVELDTLMEDKDMGKWMKDFSSNNLKYRRLWFCLGMLQNVYAWYWYKHFRHFSLRSPPIFVISRGYP
jgi:hypothetical protein